MNAAQPAPGRSRVGRWAAEGVALLAIVVLGAILRFEPVRRAGGSDRVELDFDPAFHLRIAAAVRTQGAVPEPDPLGYPPTGRPVAALLPTLLYSTVAGFDRLLGVFGYEPGLQATALILTAILGGMIAIPLWGAARGLGLGPVAALIAAAFAATAPAHIHRTAAHWIRYDALGSLCLLAHAALLAVALGARRGPRVARATAGAALALAVALAAWRVSLLALTLEALAVLALFLARAIRLHHLLAFAPSLAAGLAVSLLVPYLLQGPFLLSRTGALVFLTLGLLLLDAATSLHALRGLTGHLARAGLVAAILGVSLFLGAPATYDRLGDTLAWKLGGARSPVEGALFATNAELESPLPQHLLAPDYCSALLPCALLFALGRHFPRRRSWVRDPAPGRESGLRFWHLMTGLLLALTFLFARNKVLLGPALALYPALLWRGLDAGSGGGRGSGAGRRRWHPRQLLAAALVLVALAYTTADALRLTAVLPTRLAPDDRQILSWLRTAGRPGDVLLGDWGRGYAVELHAGLASATDGLLEVPGMPERIAAFGRALYAEDETPLAELCREVGARYLWVPGDKRRVHAAYAGLDYDAYFQGPRATALGARTCYARLLSGTALPGIRPRLRAGGQVVCEVIPDSLPPASR